MGHYDKKKRTRQGRKFGKGANLKEDGRERENRDARIRTPRRVRRKNFVPFTVV